jgi:alkylated DNA repair dioxygenase AlkB
LEYLIKATPWRSDSIVVWGKSHMQPRLIAWFGDSAARYSYSSVRLEPLPWTSELLALKTIIEAATGGAFNSVLLNYYRDHNDSMGLHSDSERELGKQPVIASLSLGDARTIIFKHRTKSNLAPIKIALQSGSLLLMKGHTQSHWKHGIRKESQRCGPRVNLTFRRIVS